MKESVEIVLLKEWYVRQTHIQDRMRNHIEEINFEINAKQTISADWMENVVLIGSSVGVDGINTEFRILYSEDESRVIVPPAGDYVQYGTELENSRVLDRESREDLGSFSDLQSSLGKIVMEEKVFDTWMDSSNSNSFVLGYLNDPETLRQAFPTGIRPQERMYGHGCTTHCSRVHP